MPLLIGGGAAAFLSPWCWLLLRRRSQLKSFDKELLAALERLLGTLRAGNSCAAGLKAVASEMPQTIAGKFCFVHVEQNLGLPIDWAHRNMLQRVPNMQLQMGKQRREALHDLGVRTGVDDVKGLAAILIQADRFGSSIGQTLRVHFETMRVKRRQLA